MKTIPNLAQRRSREQTAAMVLEWEFRHYPGDRAGLLAQTGVTSRRRVGPVSDGLLWGAYLMRLWPWPAPLAGVCES